MVVYKAIFKRRSFTSMQGRSRAALSRHQGLARHALFNATALAALGAVAIAGIHPWRYRTQQRRLGLRRLLAVMLCAMAVLNFVGWMTGIGVALERPRLQRFNFVGGHVLTPEFAAIFLGLVLY